MPTYNELWHYLISVKWAKVLNDGDGYKPTEYVFVEVEEDE